MADSRAADCKQVEGDRYETRIHTCQQVLDKWKTIFSEDRKEVAWSQSMSLKPAFEFQAALAQLAVVNSKSALGIDE